MLGVWLAKEGYRTFEACDGGEALDVMRTRRVDLVLLDLMMPNVTGWQVLSERAAAPELRAIPVIVITAGRGDQVMKIAKEDICTLLPKPFEFDRLREVLKSCLGTP